MNISVLAFQFLIRVIGSTLVCDAYLVRAICVCCEVLNLAMIFDKRVYLYQYEIIYDMDLSSSVHWPNFVLKKICKCVIAITL